jgi:DNA modification methylase
MSTLKKKVAPSLGRLPVHPFPARMAPSIALGAISRSRRKLRVFDPMMGSGTVLAAARARGHYASGTDLDPLAVLISSVWTTAVNRTAIRRTARAVLLRAHEEFNVTTVGDSYPDGADKETRAFIRYWFDPYARRQLYSLAKAIARCRNTRSRNVLWCAFSRLIITKQAGASLALDLAHSRPHKYFDKAPIKPFSNFLKSVDRVLQNCISETDKNRGPVAYARLGDARNLRLEDGSIDLVLTSPPYLNAIDYLRCSKFSLVWMGCRTEELRRLRSKAVGTELGEYETPLASPSRHLIAQLGLKSRLTRRKQAVLSRFITDMQGAIAEAARVLVPGGRAIYVIGENTVEGTYIQNAKIIIALAEIAGLKLRSQIRRALPPNRRYLPPPNRGRQALDVRMRREVVLQFVKPKA